MKNESKNNEFVSTFHIFL